ncbi:MAG: PRC-barrel domain-containing protein [Candidatus Pacearchaeota archaeon]
MLKIRKISEVIGKKVYSDSGDFIGVVEELNLLDNKVDGWRVVVSRNSKISQTLGGARGLIIPQNFIKSVGDVVVISKEAIPIRDEDVSLEEEIEESNIESLD